jgi:hypothetical protein
MLFGLSGERGRARRLFKLAENTIKMMGKLLLTVSEKSPEYKVIWDYMQERMEERDGYQRFSTGNLTEEEKFAEKYSPMLAHSRMSEDAMNKELTRFGSSAAAFAAYIKAVRAP